MTTTMAEPEWDEDTRTLVLGHAAVDLCPVCGGPAVECQDPENQFAYTVLPPVRCHRKTALVEAQQRVTEKTNPIMSALLWRVALKAAR